MVVPSGERLRGKGRHGILCRLNCVIHAWALQGGLYTMQGAIQVFCFTFYLTSNAYLTLSLPLTLIPMCGSSEKYLGDNAPPTRKKNWGTKCRRWENQSRVGGVWGVTPQPTRGSEGTSWTPLVGSGAIFLRWWAVTGFVAVECLSPLRVLSLGVRLIS